VGTVEGPRLRNKVLSQGLTTWGGCSASEWLLAFVECVELSFYCH